MAIVPSDKPLSIKDAAGEDRSIAQFIDGNLVGDKSLLQLANTAGLDLPTSMSNFHGQYGYYGHDGSEEEEEWNFEAIGASNLSNTETESMTYMDFTPYPIGHENLFDTVIDGNDDTPVITRGFDGDNSWMYIPLGINNLI